MNLGPDDWQERGREGLSGRLGAWLNRVLADEDPPQGLAASVIEAIAAEEGAEVETPGVLYGMQEAVCALTQEVRLQGRAFKSLETALAPLPALEGAVGEVLEAHRQALEKVQASSDRAMADRVGEAKRRGQGEVLDVLLDMRDRLHRGLEPVRRLEATLGERRPSGWLSRVLARPATAEGLEAVVGMREGYELSLARLDAALQQMEVRETTCLGRPFDPLTMQAVEVEETDRVPIGTVTGVLRAGYAWRGEAIRVAQVKVARTIQYEGAGE